MHEYSHYGKLYTSTFLVQIFFFLITLTTSRFFKTFAHGNQWNYTDECGLHVYFLTFKKSQQVIKTANCKNREILRYYTCGQKNETPKIRSFSTVY